MMAKESKDNWLTSQDIWRNFVISVTIMTAAFSTPELAEDASKEFAENSADVILLLSSIVTQLTTEAYEKRQNMTLQKTVRRVTSLQHFTKKSFIRQGSLDLPDACSVTDTIQKEAIASLRCVQQMRRSPSPIHTDSVLKSVAPDDSAALQDPQTFWDEVVAKDYIFKRISIHWRSQREFDYSQLSWYICEECWMHL